MDAKREGMDERRVACWIGKFLLIKGDIVASGDLVIDGRVEGTIELGDHSLTIGPGAEVTADLVAKTVTVSGNVKGNVTGLARVELKATGSIEGNVNAPKFVMDDGATLKGNLETGKPR